MKVHAGDYDVVVVGSGAGGAAAAWALAMRGVRVLVLEAGPRFDPVRDYRLHLPDWERHGFPEPGQAARHTFGPMQALDPRHEDLRTWNRVRGRFHASKRRRVFAYHHVRGVGGSTLHFQADAHRLHPEAMQMRTRFGVAADWPLDYAELEPYYEQAEAIVGVAGPGLDSLRPRRNPHPLPPHPPSHASRRILAAGEALGMRWEANAKAILSQPHDGRPGCNYCANCARGCPRRDKGSVDVTFLRRAEASGRCTVLPEALVLRIEAGVGDRVRAVVFRHRGRTISLAVRVLVLACGAVETPRLLLLSAGGHAPEGIANETGQVGRHFMETLLWVSSGLHPEPLGSYRGVPSDVISWSSNAPNAIPGVIGGCRFHSNTPDAGFVGPIAYATRVVPGWGDAHKRAMRQAFGHVLSVGAIGESLPDARAFVDLDPEVRDGSGAPVARINTYQSAGELDRLAFMAGRCRAILQAAGIRELVEEYGSYDYFSATHVFGTCRMGTRADDSVVDAAGRAHRWRNLYVSDASVFPSSGGGESPALTIEALAIRSADRIHAALARGEA